MATFFETMFGGFSLRRPSFFRNLRRMLRVYNERAALAGLDDRMLKDIGLTYGEARKESNRAVWDI